MKLSAFALVAATLAATVADQIPLQYWQDEAGGPFNIAIIGAGAAGSSAAYYLSRFANESCLDRPLNITIFEATDRIGGRTTTINALDDPRYPVELGASIFVEINQILFNASRDFKLKTKSKIYESTGSAYDLGIWDGESFVFTLPNRGQDSGLKGMLGNWWDSVKILWKYGLSPIRLRPLQQSTIGRFLRLYDELFPFKDLTEVADKADLLSTTAQGGSEFLAVNGISEPFSREIIQASSRVNYAQNLPDFHGLETMVCMSTDGAMGIEGGNWQIFEQMVKRSGAKVIFNTTVHALRTKISPQNNAGSGSGSGTNEIDATRSDSVSPSSEDISASFTNINTIILAAPLNTSQLTLHPPPPIALNRVDYVSLHVSLFTTPFRPSPVHFNLPWDARDQVPDSILTTLPSHIDSSLLGRGIEAVGPAKIWSLSTLGILHPQSDSEVPAHLSSGQIPAENLQKPTYPHPGWPGLDTSGAQYLYKIFSPAPLSAEYLIDLFGWCNHPSLLRDLMRRACDTSLNYSSSSASTHAISTLPKDLLSWSHEKCWNSYPYLPPTRDFDCFDLYDCQGRSPAPPEQGAEEDRDWKGKLWYTSGMERFISTMETSALSGMNVARLIVDRLKVEEEEARSKDA